MLSIDKLTTQSSIPLGHVNRVLACLAGVKVGHVHLCLVPGNTVISYDRWRSVTLRWVPMKALDTFDSADSCCNNWAVSSLCLILLIVICSTCSWWSCAVFDYCLIVSVCATFVLLVFVDVVYVSESSKVVRSSAIFSCLSSHTTKILSSFLVVLITSTHSSKSPRMTC